MTDSFYFIISCKGYIFKAMVKDISKTEDGGFCYTIPVPEGTNPEDIMFYLSIGDRLINITDIMDVEVSTW